MLVQEVESCHKLDGRVFGSY